MEDKNSKLQSLQKKSHAALAKLLSNIGIVGAALAAVADIIFVVIMVVGVNVQADIQAVVIFAVVNALVGVLINVLLRYQGQKYAEIENEELCKAYYNKKIKEKKYMSMETWMGLKTLQDFLIKGCTTAFSIFGIIYITIQGSKNPIQLLFTLATLVLFACFGLISLNAAYTRYYNIQVPYMQKVLEERQKTSNKKKKVEVNKPDVSTKRKDLKKSSGASTGESGSDQNPKDTEGNS